MVFQKEDRHQLCGARACCTLLERESKINTSLGRISLTMANTAVGNLLAYMERERISLADMTTAVLSHQSRHIPHPFPFLLNNLIVRTREMHMVFFYRPECVSTTVEWAHEFMVRRYSEALHPLSHNDSSLHFNILHAETWQIQEFRLEDMAARIWRTEPLLWSMVYRLVTGDVTGANEEPLAAAGCEDSEELDDSETDEEEERANDEGFAWRRDNTRKSRAFHEIVSRVHRTTGKIM